MKCGLEEIAERAVECFLKQCGTTAGKQFVYIYGGKDYEREELELILGVKIGGEDGFYVYSGREKTENELAYIICIDEYANTQRIPAG